MPRPPRHLVAIVALLLLTTIVGAQELAPIGWTPQQLRDPYFWLATAYLSHLKTNLNGSGQDSTGAPTNAANNGDRVGQPSEAIFGHRLVAGIYSGGNPSISPAWRAQLYSDATQRSALQFGVNSGGGSNTGYMVINSQKDFRFPYTKQVCSIAFKLHLDSTGVSQCIMGNATGTTTTATGVGFILSVNTSNKLRLIVYDSSSKVAIGGITNVALNTGTAVWNNIVLTWDGTVWKIYQNGAAAVSGTTVSLSNSLTTDASANLQIGITPDGASPLVGEIADLVITRSIMSAAEIATYNAYNPPRTTAQAIFVKSTLPDLEADDVYPQFTHHDTSNIRTLLKFDQTTPVSADGDTIGVCQSLTGGYPNAIPSRALIQPATRADTTGGSSTASQCPLYKVAQVNGMPAAYYSGTDASEQDLQWYPTGMPHGDMTCFFVMKLDATITGGGPGGINDSSGNGTKRRDCHFWTTGFNDIYAGVSGPGNSDPNRVFQHTTDPTSENKNPETTVAQSIAGVPIIIEQWRSGVTWNIAMNGIQRAVLNGTGASKYTQTIVPAGNGDYAQFIPFHIGRPAAHHASTDDDDNMLGNICEIILAPAAYPAEIRRRIRARLVKKWAIPNVNTSSMIDLPWDDLAPSLFDLPWDQLDQRDRQVDRRPLEIARRPAPAAPHCLAS